MSARATVKQSCAGSDFDTQRDKTGANANYARLSVTVNVTGGTLTIGIKDTWSGTNWLVWDNFTLACNSIVAKTMGDVNGDNSVDVADIATVIDVMAGNADVLSATADVNKDGAVNVADMAAIIDIMASK